MNNVLVGCHDISIYVGNTCNFDCTYCDRDYIKNTIGGQMMSGIEEIITFMHQVLAGDSEVQMISFHGGEPFVYIKFIDAFMDQFVSDFGNKYKFFIQTNGSLIEKHKSFIDKWNKQLIISISYDFMFQKINRSEVDIVKVALLLVNSGVYHVQYQYVMPINDRAVFSFNSLQNIISTCRKTGISHIDLIPLRHIRGGDKFEVIIDQINLNEFFGAFLAFIQMLYIQHINVVIDGHSSSIDKGYFAHHKQIILSPDGYIYPEYDFLEYKVESARVGRWKTDNVAISRNIKDQEDSMLLDTCKRCDLQSGCGLKFLYYLFDTQPKGPCAVFYKMMDTIINHNIKLKQHSNLLTSIGI